MHNLRILNYILSVYPEYWFYDNSIFANRHWRDCQTHNPETWHHDSRPLCACQSEQHMSCNQSHSGNGVVNYSQYYTSSGHSTADTVAEL